MWKHKNFEPAKKRNIRLHAFDIFREIKKCNKALGENCKIEFPATLYLNFPRQILKYVN